ncbi:MAG: ADP-ribosylglycohydrolase [Geobacteraceae bacterium]|nr:ADP-ribosylglycohydrolase [Geobacteraceae bacterium]
MSLDDALLSLEGLSVGDAFGELFFFQSPAERELPEGPWRWTDDTHMALSIVEILRTCGNINQDDLAKAFAERFMQQPWRGYAGGAKKLLTRIACGEDWRKAALELFGGGSYGNGGAMRAAPIGGFFSEDPTSAAREARLSAMITHAHPEGQAGAMAVAAAAAIASGHKRPAGRDFLLEVMAFVPESLTRQRIEAALHIPAEDLSTAVRRLGTGTYVSAPDTVPFCLWSAAYHLDDFTGAMWWTVSGLGDRDTTCAIVGGIVALSSRRIPLEWIGRREPLPEGFSRMSD